MPTTKKGVFAYLAFVVLVGTFVVSLVSSHTSASSPSKLTDLQSVKQLLAQPAYAAAVDYFLKLDGIPGESTDSKHPDEITLDSFSWGAQRGTQSSGGGGGAGKVSLQDLSFTMKVNKASPKLYLACASGKHIKTGVLAMRKAGGDQQEFLTLTFSDLLCKSYQEKGDGQSILPEDQLSLTFSKVMIDYHPTRSDGTLGASETAAFDFTENKVQ